MKIFEVESLEEFDGIIHRIIINFFYGKQLVLFFRVKPKIKIWGFFKEN
jgi:hypothetical protein